MRAVIQRVSQASVTIDQKIIGQIDRGFMILLGIHEEDTQADADYLIRKIPLLRVFEDAEGKMNQSLQDVGGSVLSVSQFTLYADTKKGNRPSFVKAARPETAIPLYEYFNEGLTYFVYLYTIIQEYIYLSTRCKSMYSIHIYVYTYKKMQS